jgi:hypothetical protein
MPTVSRLSKEAFPIWPKVIFSSAIPPFRGSGVIKLSSLKGYIATCVPVNAWGWMKCNGMIIQVKTGGRREGLRGSC